MNLLKKSIASIIMIAALGTTSALYDLTRPHKAEAQILNSTILDAQRWVEFWQVEAQEITTDQIRKIVIKQVTKKVIDKIVGGESGGVSGSGSAFVDDYGQYIYGETNKDVRRFIDDEFDRQFPSYLDPALKESIKANFDESASYIPSDCVDVRTIDFKSDPDAINKLLLAAQPGCNEISAQVILQDNAQRYSQALVEQAKTELTANKGLTVKDEDSNILKKSGVELEGYIQGSIQAIFDVQTNSESAVSSIIGAFIDQILDELLDE